MKMQKFKKSQITIEKNEFLMQLVFEISLKILIWKSNFYLWYFENPL